MNASNQCVLLKQTCDHFSHSKYLLLTPHTIPVTASFLCSFTIKFQKICLYSPSIIFHFLFLLVPTPMKLLSTDTAFIQAYVISMLLVYWKFLLGQPEVCFTIDHSLFLELLHLTSRLLFSSGFPSTLLATSCQFTLLVLHCVPNLSI